MVINDDFKNTLIEKLNDIITLNHHEWDKIDKSIKLKYIHRLCNYLENDNEKQIKDNIIIPLKSIKPKKLIQYCGYSKQLNTELYSQFNKLILNYTFEFRKKYINIPKRKYYTYNNLPKNEHDLILYDLTEIVYCFIIKNKINIENLLKLLVGSNYDKLIITQNEKNNYNINSFENNIELITDNFKIIFTLNFTSNQITKNIPVLYYIKLINNI
jgi:hypothetical protein